MKILIAEDDATNALLLQRTLAKAGHSVILATDGKKALAALEKEPFDALLTDWMMPEIDGIELLRRARESCKAGNLPLSTMPVVMMLTTLSSNQARQHALHAGADDYLAKPYDPKQVLTRLADLVRKRDQAPPTRVPTVSLPPIPSGKVIQSPLPPFVGVVVAASTGGPQAIIDVFRGLPLYTRAAFFLVIHGPAWMLETFAERLQNETPLKVHLAQDGMTATPGSVYLAPGDRHLCVQSVGETISLALVNEPPENFVRPAADPLFRSAAKVFGKFCMAVILTGLGRDGSLGAEQIAQAGGTVVAQDPSTAIASSMPQSVISMGIAREIIPLDGIPSAIVRLLDKLSGSRDLRSLSEVGRH